CAGHTLEGIDFRGAGVLVKPYGADESLRPERVEIKNCRIHHHLYGIQVERGKAIYVHDNDVSDNFDDTGHTYFGAGMGNVEAGGIRFTATEDSTIERNTANGSANGIYLRDSARIIVRD